MIGVLGSGGAIGYEELGCDCVDVLGFRVGIHALRPHSENAK